MDERRELQLIRKQLDTYHRNVGETVLWAAYDPAQSVADTVYNEPGERVYSQPVQVQTLWINLTEGGKRLDDERYDVKDHLNLAVSAEALRNAGIPDIFNDPIRVLDVFMYWGRTWMIVDYEILGRYRIQDSTTISILASEIDLPGDYPFEPNAFTSEEFPSLGNQLNTLRHGNGVPSNSLGIDGDYYVDESQSEFTLYGPKGQDISGVWPTPPLSVSGTIFNFTQSTPSTAWLVTHNLGHYPVAITVRLTDGTVVEPDRTDLDVNNVLLTFSQPYTGSVEVL